MLPHAFHVATLCTAPDADTATSERIPETTDLPLPIDIGQWEIDAFE